MCIFIENIKVWFGQIDSMQSNHHHSHQNLFAGIFSLKDGNHFYSKFIDSVCLHLAVLDNGDYDKFVANFWSFGNAFDSAGQFDKLWGGKRTSHFVDFSIRLETLCPDWTYHTGLYCFCSSQNVRMDREGLDINRSCEIPAVKIIINLTRHVQWGPDLCLNWDYLAQLYFDSNMSKSWLINVFFFFFLFSIFSKNKTIFKIRAFPFQCSPWTFW